MPRRRNIRLNDRDVRTLATLGDYGVLSRPLCHALCFDGFTSEWCRQNLARLADAGLVQTTTLQVCFDDGTSRGGRMPVLYSLSNAGADIVREATGQSPLRVLRSEPSPATFWHRLQIVQCRVAFDLAAANEGLTPPYWIFEQDLRTDAVPGMPQHRRVLYHEFRRAAAMLTCQPDAAAVLRIPHPTGDQANASTLAIHFEIDRSREGIAQCLAKLPGYAALFEERSYTRYWPDLPNPTFRVFWIVPSRQRIDSLSAAMRDKPVASTFRFIAVADCVPERLLTEAVWYNVQGTPLTLYRKPKIVVPPIATPGIGSPAAQPVAGVAQAFGHRFGKGLGKLLTAATRSTSNE